MRQTNSDFSSTEASHSVPDSLSSSLLADEQKLQKPGPDLKDLVQGKSSKVSATKTPASVYITSAYSDTKPISDFLENVKSSPLTRHTLVEDPAAADIILFIENSRYHEDRYFKKLKNHHLVKQYPQKVFMYNPHDTPWFILPGLYPAMPNSRFDSSVMASSAYIETHNSHIFCDFTKEPGLLFSFRGSPYTQARARVLKLNHPRGETKAFVANIYGHGKFIKAPQIEFAELLANTKYVLCPKGIGISTSRIFETMQAGRVPVIIADEWVQTYGLNWNEFAVFIKEADIEKIPQILEAEEPRWEQKARLARKTWEQHFAPEVVFNYMIDTILNLKNLSNYRMSRSMAIAHYFAKENFRFRFFRHQVKVFLQEKLKLFVKK